MIPIVIAVLQSVATPGINIVGMTMLLQFVVSFGFILVVNAPQNMVAYGTETFEAQRFRPHRPGADGDRARAGDAARRDLLALARLRVGATTAFSPAEFAVHCSRSRSSPAKRLLCRVVSVPSGLLSRPGRAGQNASERRSEMPGVKRERDDSVGVLTLDEPETLNAMTPDLLGDLATAIGEMTR